MTAGLLIEPVQVVNNADPEPLRGANGVGDRILGAESIRGTHSLGHILCVVRIV